jgi:hypothetical protein
VSTSTRDEPDLRDETEVLRSARVEAQRAFAAHSRIGRNAVWWAMVIALVGIGTIAGAFVYSYYYLRLGADNWPLPGTDLRSWEMPAAALALAAVGVLVAPSANRGRILLVVAALAGTAALAVQLVALIDSGYRIDANAYEALVITIEAISIVILAAALVLRGFAIAFFHPHARPSGLHDADAALWIGTIGLWSVLWLVVHVSPRVI